jgi:hypothetical protein
VLLLANKHAPLSSATETAPMATAVRRAAGWLPSGKRLW